MSLGRNIQYLRKQKGITQEQFAERMAVSRQTVSRWERDEVTPELSKLREMCELFVCKLDALVREELAAQREIYSEVSIRRVPAFRMARYVIISPNPEDDVGAYMQNWARNSGLLSVCPEVKMIGWDFPFVTQEQQSRFGLRGYVAACVPPEGFTAGCPGVEYCENREADYAVITITDPFEQPFERIPNAYRRIMEYLEANNFREKPQENVISCFEHEYRRGEATFMDVYIHVDSVTRADSFSQFNA